MRKCLLPIVGKIAQLAVRTRKELRIQSMAISSDADASSRHIKLADEAVHISPALSCESYLAKDNIMKAALDSRPKQFISDNGSSIYN